MTWMILSCEEFCEESNRTAMVANFYDSETGLAKTMQNMTVKGIDNDVLYDGGSLKTLLLPLNPAVDSTGYVIVNDTIAIDTIIIRYTRHPGFISSECGCVTYSNITDDIGKTNHSIKEITITNRGVTTVSYRENVVNAENIGIYY
jgi:hypothetical protein